MDGRAHDGPDGPDPEARGAPNIDAGLKRGVAPSDSAVLPSGGVALVFRTIRALPLGHFRLARRGKLDFVPIWQGRPGSGETRLRLFGHWVLRHGNFRIIPVAETGIIQQRFSCSSGCSVSLSVKMHPHAG